MSERTMSSLREFEEKIEQAVAARAWSRAVKVLFNAQPVDDRWDRGGYTPIVWANEDCPNVISSHEYSNRVLMVIRRLNAGPRIRQEIGKVLNAARMGSRDQRYMRWLANEFLS